VGLLATSVAAQEDYSTRIGITLGGGYGKYTGGNLDHSDLGPVLQAALRLGWKRHLDLSVGVRYGSFSATQLPDSSTTDPGGNATPVVLQYDNQTTQVDFGLVYNWNPEARWTPIVFGGGGVSFWDVVDLTNESSGLFASGDVLWGYKNDGNRELLSDGNFHLDFGLGVEFEVFRRAALQLGGRIDWLLGQNKDNTGASAAFASAAQVDANEFLSSAFVGFTYFFTERDSDLDGVPNRSDACPYGPEDKDGYQDFDGCPDADNDNDGIPDAQDKCADQAEDKDGHQDDDGCPDGDNDGDGIADAQDRCPDQAEDKDGHQDDDGCPDPDDDGDGVPDGRDQCAGTPAGVPVDTLGCPTVARIDAARVFAGIRFRSGSADLEPSSFATLDSIVASLHAYPAVDVEVRGHTSDLGDHAKNLQLSQSRAEAVVAYLVSRGIASRRLTPIGYGEEQPLVPNDSPANRGRNERIVIAPMESAPLEAPPEKRE
jgi:outer membrane protein OmpA-like peptidoglycan-associated protein